MSLRARGVQLRPDQALRAIRQKRRSVPRAGSFESQCRADQAAAELKRPVPQGYDWPMHVSGVAASAEGGQDASALARALIQRVLVLSVTVIGAEADRFLERATNFRLLEASFPAIFLSAANSIRLRNFTPIKLPS